MWIVRLVRNLVRRAADERETDAELQAYLEAATDEYLRRGCPPAEAERHARLALGSVEAVKDGVRDARTGARLENLLHDARHAWRVWTRRPVVAITAVMTIAVGIGTLTTVFGLVNAVLLHSLPFDHVNRVVLLWHQDLSSGRDRATLSTAAVLDYAERSRSFDAFAAARGVSFTVDEGSGPTRAVDGVQVTPSLFATLGLRPSLGRALTSDDAGERVALISDGFWRDAFGRDASVLHRTIRLRSGSTADAGSLDGRYSIVGVLPPGVSLLYRNGDVWIPLRLDHGTATRSPTGVLAFFRLAPGVTLSSATDDVRATTVALTKAFPELEHDLTSWLVPLKTEDVGDVRPTLQLLGLSVGLLALLVCVNVGNMLLGAFVERGRELAVRGAIGASRGRLVQQLLVESALLGAVGAAGGALLAVWLTRVVAASGVSSIPRIDRTTVDLSALIVATAAAIAMTVAFGLVPARQASRDLRGRLTVRGTPPDARRLRNWFVIAEVALAFVVVVGAGLAIVSASAIARTNVGYEPAGVLTFRVALPAARYASETARRAFFDALLDRLTAAPGIVSAGAVNILPQMDTNRNVNAALDDRPGADGTISVRFRIASPGYFKAIGTRLVQGRDFAASDVTDGAVIVSRSFRDRYFAGVDPIGHHVQLRMAGSSPTPWLPIVGIVEDVRQWVVTRGEPTIYWANFSQPALALAVRTASGDPMMLASTVAAAVHAIDPEQPVFDVRTLSDRLTRSQQFAYAQFRVGVMTAFGVAALALACLGIFGVVRYTVIQRVPEFGIRLALGASPQQLIGLVVTQSLRLVAAGSAAGIALSLAVSRGVASVFYGVSGHEGGIVVVAAAVLAVCAVGSSYGPARRISRLDPVDSLRSN